MLQIVQTEVIGRAEDRADVARGAAVENVKSDSTVQERGEKVRFMRHDSRFLMHIHAS